MAKNPDIITGTWTAKIKRTKRGRFVSTSCVNFRGIGQDCTKEVSDSILGDVRNERTTRKGHVKADTFENNVKTAEIIIHKGALSEIEDATFLDGRIRVSRSRDVGFLFDNDIQSNWIARFDYVGDPF